MALWSMAIKNTTKDGAIFWTKILQVKCSLSNHLYNAQKDNPWIGKQIVQNKYIYSSQVFPTFSKSGKDQKAHATHS
jgi:hypothetical protein